MTEATDKVVPLPKREGKVYNYELTFNLGNKAQARFLTDFDQAGDPKVLAANLDALNAQGRRQQMIYEVDDLNDLIRQAEDQIVDWSDDHNEAEMEHIKELARIDIRIKEFERQRALSQTAAQAANDESGRRNVTRLLPAQRQDLRAIEEKVKAQQAEKDNLDKQRDDAKKSLEINVKKNQKLIARLHKRKVEKLQIIDSIG